MSPVINAYEVYNAKTSTKSQYGAIFFDEPPSEDILKVLKKSSSEDGGVSSAVPKRRCFFQPRLVFTEGAPKSLATSGESVSHISRAPESPKVVHRKGWLVKKEFFDEVIAELVDKINEYKFLATEPLADEYRLAEESISPSPSSSSPPSNSRRWELRIFLPKVQKLRIIDTTKTWMSEIMSLPSGQREDQTRALMDYLVEHKVFVWSEPTFAKTLRRKILGFHQDGLSLPEHFLTLFPWDPIPEMSPKEKGLFLRDPELV